MTDPPDQPGAARLHAALDELAAVEEWARRVRDGGGAVREEPAGLVRSVGSVRSVGPVGSVGSVVRVETTTAGGMHRVVAISPAAQRGEEQLAAVRSVVRALLDLAGHQEGAACTEVALTTDGPRIVACRLGGSAGPHTP